MQLAAHLALANGKGWNHSALEAILRNTAYLLLRRNLMRPQEGGYIFTSGISYGWRQWVTDGFCQAVALGNDDLMLNWTKDLVSSATHQDCDSNHRTPRSDRPLPR